MRIGISTSCYYPQPTEEALAILAGAGAPALEVFFNTSSELEPGYLRQLRRLADEAGAPIVSVHPYTSGMEGLLFFSEYSRRFEDAREYYKRYYRAANLLGAGLLVFHGAFRHQTIEVEEYARRLDILDADARAAGLRIGQENVDRNRSRDPDFMAQLHRLLPAQRFVLDLKQAVRAECDPLEMARAMGGGITHLHLSDHTADQDCLPPGQGSFDFGALFRQLKEQGFAGTAVVELYRQNFGRQSDLDRGVAFAQQCQNLL